MKVVLKLKKSKEGKDYLVSKTITQVSDAADGAALVAMAKGFQILAGTSIPEVHKVVTEVFNVGA